MTSSSERPGFKSVSKERFTEWIESTKRNIQPSVTNSPPPMLVDMPSHLDLIKTALNRLEDILKGDDPQDFKEAKKFVEQARKVIPE